MKQFQIFIVDDDRGDGGTMQVDNGVVISSAARIPLPNTPDGWQDISIGWERNLGYYGVVRNFSLSLGFVLDAGKILRKTIYTENVERRLGLLITQLKLDLTTTTFAYNYNFLYKGDLDISTASDEQSNKVMMNIMEGGLSKLIKANEETFCEFPFKDNPLAKDLYCDGIDLFQSVKYGVVDGVHYSANKATIAIAEISKEGLSADIQNFDQALEGVPWPGDTYYGTSLNYFVVNNGIQAVPALLKAHIVFRLNSVSWSLSATRNIYFYVVSNEALTPVSIYTINNPDPTGETFTFDFDFATPFFGGTAGQNYFLVVQFGDTVVDAGSIDFEFLEGSTVTSEFSSRKAPTIIKFYTLYDLYRQMIGKLTGDPENAVSALLLANLNMGVTCGDAIRGFGSAKVRTKLTDLFAAANVQFNAGMGIEGEKVTLEEKAHYFNPADPIPLGEVKSLKITEANDIMANTLRIGSAPQDYTDVNGRQEFNNITIFSSPITRVVREMSLESPYRRDSYGFEFTRINFDGKETTDTDSDNDVWLVNTAVGATPDYHILYFGLVFETQAPNLIILPFPDSVVGNSIIISDSAANNGTYAIANVIRSGGVTNVFTVEPITSNVGSGNIYTNTVINILKRGTYDEITGLLSPDTVFNLEDMTIKRLVKNHGPWLRGMFWGFDDYVLPFQTTDKNRELYTRQGAVIYDEDADIVIKDLGVPLFIPKYFEIEVLVPVNLPELLENNPAKCFSFTWRGNTYTGFLMKAGISISDNMQQVLKLLCAPGNDLSKLVV